MARLLLFIFMLLACGSSPPPAASPAPSGSAASPPCPADIATLVGKPCTTENASCGGDAAAAAKGFSNVVVCKGGTWTQVEVPPPPPPGS